MATAEEIETTVIRPMLDLFPPPIHLRGNRHAIEPALNVYRHALARFDAPILEQAFQKAAAENEYHLWPKCFTLVKAAEHYQRLAPRPGSDAETWVERATHLADAYTKRFMKTSQYAVRAREGGYEQKLKEYVWESSWVQSQMIAQRPTGIGYSSNVLFGHLEGTSDEKREQREEWLTKARKQAESGHVRVHVPRETVERWQEQAQEQGRTR